jgi:hypothetical protein
MAAVVAGALGVLPTTASTALSVLRLGLVVVVGGVVFATVGHALGIKELSDWRTRYRALVR